MKTTLAGTVLIFCCACNCGPNVVTQDSGSGGGGGNDGGGLGMGGGAGGSGGGMTDLPAWTTTGAWSMSAKLTDEPMTPTHVDAIATADGGQVSWLGSTGAVHAAHWDGTTFTSNNYWGNQVESSTLISNVSGLGGIGFCDQLDSSINLAPYTPGTDRFGFSRLIDMATTAVSQAHFAIDDLGLMSVAYLKAADDAGYDVWTSEAASTTWLPPAQITSTHSIVSLRYAGNARGDRLAVWQEADGGLTAHAWLSDGGSSDTALGGGQLLELAVGPNGDALACFAASTELRARARHGGAWSPARTLSSGTLPTPAECSVAIDGSGDALVSFAQDQHAWAARVLDGGWIPARDISNLSGVSGVRAAVNASGEGLVVWRNNADLYAAGVSRANSFGAPMKANDVIVVLDDGRPLVSSDGTRAAVFVGRDVGASSGDIYITTLH
jgi:hypothetical protein